MSDKLVAVLSRLGVEVESVEGTRAWAKCPYHADRKPSWFMRTSGERRGQHHCYSCKNGGGLVDLVMHVYGITYAGARGWVEEQGSLGELPSSVRFELAPLRRYGFKLPVGVEVIPFEKWATPPRRYAESRGINAQQVKRWGIGVAYEGRLAGRIVFIARDTAGNSRSYTGRTFVAAQKRYLEPRADEHPDASVMFGEEYWPSVVSRRRLVVVEGAINALAVERATGDAFASLSGSQVSVACVEKIATFQDVVVLTDSDPAGDKAAAELNASLVRHVALRRVRLPDGVDAQEYGDANLRESLL